MFVYGMYELIHICICCVYMCAESLSRVQLSDSMDYSPPGSSVRGISQAWTLKWVAVSSSRGSARPRDWTCISGVSCIGRWILYHCATWKAMFVYTYIYMICWYFLVDFWIYIHEDIYTWCLSGFSLSVMLDWKWVWMCSFLFHFLGELLWNWYNVFLEYLVEFLSETIWASSYLCWKDFNCKFNLKITYFNWRIITLWY